jgi:hypothetical protein
MKYGCLNTYEIQLVKLLSKITLDEADLFEINRIIHNNTVNWAQVFDQLVTHKTSIIAHRNLINKKITGYPAGWKQVFQNFMLGNEMKNREMYSVIVPLLSELYDNGIVCLPLKGIILNELVYGEYSLRQSNDFDLLVKENDLPFITNFFIERGFIQTIDAHNFTPATKAIKIFFRMNTHEIVPLIKKNDNALCPIINLDVQFDIFGRSKYTRVYFPLEELFKEIKEVSVMGGEYTLFTLNHEHTLIQLAAHLFRDMTRIQDIVTGRDLRLIYFVDILEYVTRFTNEINWDRLVSISKQYKFDHMLYYVFYHVELIFGQTFSIEFMKKIKTEDKDFLNQYGFEEGEAFGWKMPFLERVFNSARKAEIEHLNPSRIQESQKVLKILNGEM